MYHCRQTAGHRPRRAAAGRPFALHLTLLVSVLLLTVLCLAAACGGGEAERDKSPGSALWVRAEALPELGGESRERLLAAGIRELFVEAATLGVGAEGMIDHLAEVPSARSVRLPVTLVAAGEWEAASPEAEDEPDTAGEALAAALQRLRRSAEARGLTVVGYHLDVPWPQSEDGLQAAASALDAAAAALSGGGARPFLSLSAGPDDLAREGFAELAATADFLVPFLYGARAADRPGPPLDGGWDRAWDPAVVTGAAPRLAELGVPYLLGLSTVGLLQRVDAGGAVGDSTTEASLATLAAHPRLEMAFAGLDTALRQRLLFAARSPLGLAGWQLATGDRVQVVRPAPGHLRTVATELAGELGPLHLGQVYHRLPAAGEGLTLGLPAVAAAAGGDELTADLSVEVQADGRGRSRLRVTLANGGPLSTDVAFLESNFVLVRALGGGVVTAAEAGDFQRYQLEADGQRVRDMRALGRADAVRLYRPLAEPGDVVESGVVVLRGAPSSGPVVEVSGRFALPGGGEVDLPPTPWPAPPPAEATAGGES